MYYDTKVVMMTKECPSSAGHFDVLGSAPQQYRRHHPMPHVQGYSGSHWMPPPGNYLLRIAPAAARATANETEKNVPKRLAFLMAAVVHGYNTAHIAQWRRLRALLEAIKCRHWASIVANRCNRSHMVPVFYKFFHCQHVYKGHGLSRRPLFSIGVLHIKQKRRA